MYSRGQCPNCSVTEILRGGIYTEVCIIYSVFINISANSI